MEKEWKNESRKKLVDPKDLEIFVKSLRKKQETIVTLNGSFDLLHAGHLQIIYEASLQGSCLIVCLNTDESIKEYKSIKRPLVALRYRLQMMAALEFVDFVTWFDETDPIQILGKIRPDVHVNGAEYGAHCIEADTVRSFGGKIHLVQLIDGLSTTALLEKIRTCV